MHDELVVECQENVSSDVDELIKSYMVSVGEEISLKIPLKAESSGPMERWLD